MKQLKTKLTSVGSLLSVVASCMVLTSCGDVQANKESQIKVDALYDRGYELHKAVYGVNNELVGARYTIDNQCFIDAVNELGIQGFRYPAGTYSNFLDLKSHKAKMWENINEKNILRYEAIESGFERSGHDINYESLVEMLEQVETTTSFIINVSSSTFEDNMEALHDIKKRGVELTNIEFGNELYYTSYSGAIPTPEFYVERAREYMTAIREIYPNAKFSSCVKSYFYSGESFLDEPNANNKRLEEWYDCIKRNQQYFDGLSIHLYSEIGMDPDTKQADFIPYEESYRHTISHADKLFAPAMELLKRDFPGKELWITEYHVSGFMGEIRNNYHLRRTYLGALFCADFMLKLFTEPSVTISSWHALQGWFGTRGKGEERQLVPRNANYHMFKMFKEPTLNSNQIVPVKISGGKKYDGLGIHPGKFEELDGIIFYDTESKEGCLMIINKLENQYSISKSSLERGVKGTVESAQELVPDVSMEMHDALCNTQGALTQQRVEAKEGVYDIQPYSMNVYKYRSK